MKKRFLSLLCVLALCLGLLPITAFATGNGKAIQLGTSALNENLNTENAAIVYFGNSNADQPATWRVIGYDGGGVANAQGDMTLLAASTMGVAKFDSDGVSNEYATSDLKTAIDTLAEKLTTEENAAVNERTLTSESFSGNDTDYVAVSQVDDAVFWPLSKTEASAVNENLRIVDQEHQYWATSFWWLRSPGYNTYDAAVVTGNGSVNVLGLSVSREYGVRPAFHLDLNSVLFTSAAERGKSSGDVGAGALKKVIDYSGNEWKLTLLDNSRNFSISNMAINSNGDTVGFSYTGAKTGENEYISVVIKENDMITYYGRILQLDGTTNGASGTASLMLPAGVALSDTTKLYVFNEQYNGLGNDDTKLTDYGSQLIEVVNPTIDETAPTLSTGSATRNSETTATVKFASNETGKYYYAVVESGAAEPIIDTTGTGTSCASGENTLSLDSLTGVVAKDIYIVAKDAVGNVSDTLKIGIPAYIAPSYGISASPATLNFGSKTVDYTEAPAAQEVTITNTGNQPLTLTQPASTSSFEVGTLSKTVLAAGETATFTVQPRVGLAVSTYSENITVSGTGGATVTIPATFTVRQYSGGGDSDPTYSIALPSRVTGGELKLSRRYAEKGETVTLTAIPDEGYELDTLTVTDSKGKEIDLTHKGGNEYTFKMPAGRVEIEVSFREIEVELPFTDVPEGAWYADAAAYVYEHGLIAGTSATTFAPDATTSRSMIATILWRMAGSPVVNYAMDYTDVAQGQWYSEAIRWAASEGIVGGYGNGLFGTNDPITREQFAAMLYRFAQEQGYDVSIGENTNILSYTDVADLSEYAISAMQWAVGAGIINGTGDGSTLSPQGQATRAQVAVMLMRFCEEYVTW